MNRLFTLIFFLFIPHVLKAQSVIYSENFDELPTYAITGCTSQFSGMVPWQSGLPDQVGGCMLPTGGPMSNDLGTNKVACIADCGMIDYDNSNVFIYTPSINLSAVSGAWLKYDSYFEKYTDGVNTENATIEISIDGGTTWAVIQNVPANPSLSNFQTWYINLSAYNYLGDVRIGFRYSDGSGWMQGWAIDNIEVVVPAHKDLALLSATPANTLLGYVTIGQGFTHTAQVYNAGLDTITSFTLKYRQGTGPVISDSISGVTILPFATITVTDTIPDIILSQGTFPVAMWVDLPGDANINNDTAYTNLSGADFIPAKRLAIESGEGAWDGWTPRNMVYLNSIAGTGTSACLIATHQYDVMADSLYADFLAGIHPDFVPYILFDRRMHVPLDSFYTYLSVEKKYFGYADISVTGSFFGNTLTLSGSVTPATNMSGDYRLVVIVTEDSVHGTGAGYDQQNDYAAGAYGAMGGYEVLPNPVPAASMVYDHVARSVSPSMVGDYGVLPGYLYSGSPYPFTMSVPIDSAWNPAHLKAVVLLINNGDRIILNSNEMQVPLRTADPVVSIPSAGIYPNPSVDHAMVYFYLHNGETVSISVSDISGRELYEYPNASFVTGKNEISIPVQQLQTGIYLVTVISEDGKKIMKLEVVH